MQSGFRLIKRTFQGIALLVVLGMMLFGFATTYIENSPEAQERIKVSAIDAEKRVDEDSGFWTKVGALVSSWWDSDELVAEARKEKTLELKSKADRRREEEGRRFNDGDHYSSGDDYYGRGS